MNRVLLYAVNTSPQTLADGDNVNLGTAIKKCGTTAYAAGNVFIVGGKGDYFIDTNVTFASSGAGTATIQLYRNGVIIPGAKATTTVSNGGVYAMNVPAVVTRYCPCNEPIVISMVISGVATIVSNVATVVESV